MSEESIVTNSDDPNWPYPSFDAADWAKAFCKTAINLGYSEMDEGWVLGWFANAIMRGYDEAQWRHERVKSASRTPDV